MVWWLVYKQVYFCDSCINVPNKRNTLSLLLFTFNTNLRSVSLKAGNGPENSEALPGHSFCFFGTECLDVHGQLGRLAGRVIEGGKCKRQRERERERKRRGRPYRTICDEAHLHNGT